MNLQTYTITLQNMTPQERQKELEALRKQKNSINQQGNIKVDLLKEEIIQKILLIHNISGNIGGQNTKSFSRNIAS